MFSWDASNTSHIALHGISPEEVEQVIIHHPFDLEVQFRNGEIRMVQVGETTARRILVVITTQREDVIRVVTSFPANRNMRQFYLAQKDKVQNAEDAHNA